MTNKKSEHIQLAAQCVLDLDVDLFLNHVATLPIRNTRLPSKQYSTWSISAVRCFLEERCGLSKDHRVRGRIVTDHDEAFYAWREWIKGELLKPKFRVVHADAHGDLGSLGPGYVNLMTEYMHMSEHEQALLSKVPGLDLDNFLSFACASGWVAELVMVEHPREEHVIPFNVYCHGGVDRTTNLVYKAIAKEYLDNIINLKDGFSYEDAPPQSNLIEVPYRREKVNEWHATEQFDFMILARSPEYTPVESDALIPIIEEYMELI
jgi:hypothetical protein